MRLLLSSLGIYLALYFIYYPQTYTIFDEACYLDLSYALRQGTVYLEQADLPTLHYPIKVNNHFVSIYPIGNSILLLPFTYLGKWGLFLYGLLFHILGYAIFIKVLKQANIDIKYAILYLFYPPQVLFSRTIMSDIPAAVFVLLAFYCYQREKYTLSGVALGISFIIRYVGIALLPVFLALAIIKKRWQGLKICIGFIPFLIFVLAYNYVVYGGVLNTGYPIKTLSFDLHRYGLHILIYLLSLSIFYPLMLIAPFIYKKAYRTEILSSFFVLFIFLLLTSFAFCIYAEPSAKSIIKTSLLAVRYFFPIIPLLLIAYSSICEKYLSKFFRFIGVWVILIITSIGIHYYHHRYLDEQSKFKNILYLHTSRQSLIICNGEASELISPIWGKRITIPLESGYENISHKTDAHKDIWLAILTRLDRPTNSAIVDSILTNYTTQLVAQSTGIDKEFKLLKIVFDKYP
ncbi:MAG: hypothetical protein HY769_03485 [Candidatus Stahlbacteria bacterium]|nr:hypothetical protein [Candidatus Stahlbacteria bacterium]